MYKLDSGELFLLKKAVKCKMEKLMNIMEKTDCDIPECAIELYDDYAELYTKLSIIENEYIKGLFK